MSMRVHSLTIHADYACRHSGACCTSRWPIPVERRSFEQLSERIAAGRIILPDARHELRAGVRCAKSDHFRPDPGSVHPFTAIGAAPAETPVIAAVRAEPLSRETLLRAIRRTDEILLHLASRERLARALSRIEAPPRRAAQG